VEDLNLKLKAARRRKMNSRRKPFPVGTGMGLGIIHTLAELNKGSFDYKRISDIEYHHGSYVYSHNSFTIDLLKDEFY